MKKWTKRDLKLLRDQLEHFVTFNALYRSTGEIARAIAERRSDVVLSGLRSFRATFLERGERNREASDHFAANPSIYGDSTPEMVERFARLATGDLRAADRLARLIARVESDGLPEEIRGYLPDRVRDFVP